MKKSIITTAAIIATTVSVWFMQPAQPHHYEMHVVKAGETVTSIVEDANKNSNAKYDVRDAIADAVAQSKKMEGGATSRSIKPGEKVAVPIYR